MSLLAPAPDHSTLNRFHAFLAIHQPATLFRDVLAFLDRVDPEDAARTPQIIDTFGMRSPAAGSPRVANLLLDLCADLITTWQLHAPPSSRRYRRSTSARSSSHPARALRSNAKAGSFRPPPSPNACWPIARPTTWHLAPTRVPVSAA